jgi:hypothetical protein
MKQIDFYKSLTLMDSKECIEKFLLYNSSLVLAGIKPSVTVTIKKVGDNLYEKWLKYGMKFLNEINLDFISLRESDNALILLIYSEEQLKNYIFKKENKKFLLKLGYLEHEDIAEYLKILEDRYNKYNCPHELGLFLGIPLEDVKDFMDCADKKCLGCGYWKVYNNYTRAKEIFTQYDKVKEHTVHHILKGDQSYDLVYKIKNFLQSA